jgi:hypothetical protein
MPDAQCLLGGTRSPQLCAGTTRAQEAVIGFTAMARKTG